MILTALWGDFTFDSKISRIKTTNVMDRTQAKFLAESALELGITRLRLYKEAYNMWSKNPDAKNAVNIQLLNQIWELPFMYPLPLPPGAGAQVKASIDDFSKNAILEGEFKLSIQNISSKLNLNSLRVDILTKIPDLNPNNPGVANNQLSVDDPNHPDHPNNPANQKDPAFSVEQQLINHLILKFNEKKEEDETFDDRYGSLDPIQLVANLKYYMSDKGANRLQNTPVEQRYPEAEQSFDEAKVSPKFGPLSSFSEMSLIPGWDEEIINLIKDEFGVFPSVQIDLNKLTDSMLRLLIPSMSPDDVKQFFEYRDDPNTPRVETQQPIENRGVDPRFMIQGGGPRIDLSGFFPERANTSYDPNKAIGGENVPYKPAGFFRSFLGDPANRKNVEAQQGQGAKWEAETARTKQRAERKQDLEDEIALREKGPNARFAAEQKRLDDKAIQDEIERNNAIDLALLKEGNEDVLRDVDMVRKEVLAAEEGKRKDRELDIRAALLLCAPPRDFAQTSHESDRASFGAISCKAKQREL
jgi:hypothetical protein